MNKAKTPKLPNWVRNLRALMDAKDFNPRSLSLKAGLNPTAVRDMLEGRSRFPRYDTVAALAEALGTTPALLMGEENLIEGVAGTFGGDLELLTEVIARLQEVTAETGRKLSPRDFAAMAATVYKRMQETETDKKKASSSIRPQIHDLLDYEMLRQKRVGRKS